MAAPNTDAKSGSEAIIALCFLMSTCKEFQADTNAFAEKIGMSGGKNVPRKINAIINEHGFEMKGGKITEVEDAPRSKGTTGSTAAPDKKKMVSKSAKATAKDSNGELKETVPKGKPVKPISRSKKRKVEVDEDAG